MTVVGGNTPDKFNKSQSLDRILDSRAEKAGSKDVAKNVNKYRRTSDIESSIFGLSNRSNSQYKLNYNANTAGIDKQTEKIENSVNTMQKVQIGLAITGMAANLGMTAASIAKSVGGNDSSQNTAKAPAGSSAREVSNAINSQTDKVLGMPAQTDEQIQAKKSALESQEKSLNAKATKAKEASAQADKKIAEYQATISAKENEAAEAKSAKEAASKTVEEEKGKLDAANNYIKQTQEEINSTKSTLSSLKSSEPAKTISDGNGGQITNPEHITWEQQVKEAEAKLKNLEEVVLKGYEEDRDNAQKAMDNAQKEVETQTKIEAEANKALEEARKGQEAAEQAKKQADNELSTITTNLTKIKSEISSLNSKTPSGATATDTQNLASGNVPDMSLTMPETKFSTLGSESASLIDDSLSLTDVNPSNLELTSSIDNEGINYEYTADEASSPNTGSADDISIMDTTLEADEMLHEQLDKDSTNVLGDGVKLQSSFADTSTQSTSETSKQTSSTNSASAKPAAISLFQTYRSSGGVPQGKVEEYARNYGVSVEQLTAELQKMKMDILN